MATTTIRSVYNNTNAITSTGNTSQTWAAKLATIATAYDSLSDALKNHAYLSVGTSIYQRTSGAGVFVCIEWAGSAFNQIRIVLLDLANKKRAVITFSSSGTFGWYDATNDTTTSNVYLSVIP